MRLNNYDLIQLHLNSQKTQLIPRVIANGFRISCFHIVESNCPKGHRIILCLVLLPESPVKNLRS